MSLHVPGGFLFSACAAGIKASGKPDLAFAMVEDSKGASASAVFTRNQVVAAPVSVGREHLRLSHGRIHAVIVNAGNANCATGAPGIRSAEGVCEDTAREIGFAHKIKTHQWQVFPSSTGIIGVPLPAQKISAALPKLVSEAHPGALLDFATAILTTDTRVKTASEEIRRKGGNIRIAGVAKGAGMIHPNMATMLVYLFTDLQATPRDLRGALQGCVDESFNNISVDGDTSTNDTVLLLAGGKSGVDFVSARRPFEEALRRVCGSLAGQIVADAEGVRHVVQLRIEQAGTTKEARQIAGAIARSPLVKTAWAGADPNWGRMLAAIGYSGVRINPSRINIYLGGQQICRHGMACAFDHAKAHECMSRPKYEIRITLGMGKTSLDFLSCDLTEEYVRINADYST